MKSFILSVGILASCAVQAQDSFPTVTPAAQAARDDDRLIILEEERQAERKALTAAENALAAAGPDADKEPLSKAVQRHTKDLAALDAEIARMGGKLADSDRSKPVKLKAASAAKVTAAVPTKDVPYWDVYRRDQTWRTR